jgi:hypothetical protein
VEDEAPKQETDISPSDREINPDAEAIYKRQVRLIHKARKYRKDWERQYKVKECEKFYLGDQGLEDGVRVLNHFLATIRVTQPNLLYENPKFLARSVPGKKPVEERLASIAESVLDVVAKQDDNLANAAGLGLLQNFFRIAVLKVVYDPKLEPNPSAGEPIFQHDPAGDVMIDREMGTPMPEIDPATGQPLVEPDFIMSDEVYRWEWVDSRRMLLPDEGPDQSKWCWIGEEVVVTLEDAKEDERFDPTLRLLLKSNETRHNKEEGKASGYHSNEDEADPEDEMLRYVECYDTKKKHWYCIAEGQDFHEPLLDAPLQDGIEDHPYAIMPGWFPIVGPEPSSWPLPFTNPWLDVQSEYNIRRNQMMNAAKRSARKVLHYPGTFESREEAIKSLQSSTDMEAVLCQNPNEKPEVLADPSSTPDIAIDAGLLLSDYRFITGQTAAKSGDTGANTATEASFMERASNLRDAELQKAVNKWLKTAGKKMWQLIKNTLTLDLWITLRGMNDKEVGLYFERTYGLPAQMMEMVPNLKQMMIAQHGQERPLKVDRETLNFQVDIDVVPGSTRPRTLAAEKAEFLEFLQIIAQAPQLLMSRALLEEMAKKYEFINASTIEELQLLAQTMMMVNQQTAGRGGEGGSPENTEGQGNKEGTQKKATAHRGAEPQ